MVGNEEASPAPIQEVSRQLQDTIRVTIQALDEFIPPSPSTPENKGLNNLG